MSKHNFRELNVWKESMNLAKLVYEISAKLPTDERFGLVSQINRCSVSIPSNIAEGSGRTTEKELHYFLNISKGSAYELETQLILIQEIFKIDTSLAIIEVQKVQKLIGGFKRFLN